MSRMPERERLERLCEPDRAFWGRADATLAGMDEVGRGPLAGPVVACCAAMPVPVTDVLVDALQNLNISARQHPIVHGDALSYSIACASILAKVERDRYMREQDALYPQYGFAKNKGYGTAEHIAALKRYGPCPLHRRSFIGSIL